MSKYRIEIDGLRAIAVIPVILYHISNSLMSHGFLGVDVFFIISGYLITSIISSQISSGTFSLSKFYLKRARRILPVAYSVLMLSLVVGYYVLLPTDLRNLSQAAVSIIGFAANIFFYFEIDYFNHFANNNPLLHFWSLSLEEQFYFVAPSFLLLIGDRKKLLNGFLLIIFFGSLYAYFKNLGDNGQLAFYSLHTRAWQLTLGALVARLRPLGSNPPFGRVKAEIISCVSLFFVITSYFGIFNIFSGSSELVISLSTAILILAVREDTYVGSMLKLNILTQLGLISYSLYLIHNPVFEFLEYVYHLELDSKIISYKLLSLPFILLLAKLSYKYLETPLRNQSSMRNKTAIVGLISISTIILIFGLIGHKTRGFENIKTNEIELLVDEELERLEINKVRTSIGKRFNPTGATKIRVFGDSFGQDVYYSLSHYLSSMAISDYSIELIDFDDPLYCQPKETTKDRFVADILIFSNYWEEACYQEASMLMNKLSKNQHVFFVSSSAYPRMKSLSILKKKKNLNLSELETYAYKNQRWDRLKTSQKMENSLSYQVKKISRSEFFSGINGDTVNLFNSKGEALIWDNAHLTSRAYFEFGKYLLMKIEVAISL